MAPHFADVVARPDPVATQPPRLAWSPLVWLGLANVSVLSAALVASMRQRYYGDWQHAWDQLPDPRWIVALTVGGIAVLMLKPGKWAVATALATLLVGLAIFGMGVRQHIVASVPVGRQDQTRLITAHGWQEWIDTPMRAEGLAAIGFAVLALVALVVVTVVRPRVADRMDSDPRWWVTSGSFAILVTATVALLRLWHTQDTMHREVGSAGFLLLSVVAASAALAALLVRSEGRVWLVTAALGVATVMCWGPALAWADQTSRWPGPALIHQSMVAEGVSGFALGAVGVVAAVVTLKMRFRAENPRAGSELNPLR
jgi:hypothetical protein